MFVHSAEIATNAVQITAERLLTRLLEASICIKVNLTKNIH
jgi:hypothetical protein